tara:strand:- start:22 stop:267 length:246 start_codon:yes stop_codon:yes gene_type:complete
MRNYKLPTLPQSITVTVPTHPSILTRFAAKAAIKSVAGLTKLTVYGVGKVADAVIDIKHQVDLELAAQAKKPMATYNKEDK